MAPAKAIREGSASSRWAIKLITMVNAVVIAVALLVQWHTPYAIGAAELFRFGLGAISFIRAIVTIVFTIAHFFRRNAVGSIVTLKLVILTPRVFWESILRQAPTKPFCGLHASKIFIITIFIQLAADRAYATFMAAMVVT